MAPTAKVQVLCHLLPPLGLEPRRGEIPLEIPAYNPVTHCSLPSQGLASESSSHSWQAGCADHARMCFGAMQKALPLGREKHPLKVMLSSNGLAASASGKLLFSE